MFTLHFLDEKLWFPPYHLADEQGLLAAGGDLSVSRLLLAYKKGIFPWYQGNMPLWWCPDPRFVLFPENLYVSKSMKQVMKRGVFSFTQSQAFGEVIWHCSKIERSDQDGTWISNDMIAAYEKLHEMGVAVSYEAWHNGQLAGGLYGIRMGNVFFGESMFSRISNASKATFIWSVEQMKKEGVVIIDCQVYTEHLESLGASFISRQDFLEIIADNIGNE